MSKSNAFEDDFLNHIFLNLAIADVGDASGLQPSGTAGNLFISLHSADPGEAGDQSTNELSYTGYGRVAVGRSGSNWTVASGTVDNDNTITFGEKTDAGMVTATHFGIGVAVSGSTKLLYSGAVTDPVAGLVIAQNVTPRFDPGDLNVTED